MTDALYRQLLQRPIAEIRSHIRSGAYTGHTAGFAPGKLQANLAILEGNYADDFLNFCFENSQPCPLVGVTRRGDPNWDALGDIDIRTDIPSYNIYRHGELSETVIDITDYWTDEMVGFALGCSFTFERALADAGIEMKHITANTTVPMYKTNIALKPVGSFTGEMVVSMRPIPRDLVDKAIAVTAAYPHAHGAPVHVGDGAAIGIRNVDQPDWGDATPFEGDDVAVYWACGVTPQNVLTQSKTPLCITHTPGRMLVTDVPESDAPQVAPEILPAAA